MTTKNVQEQSDADIELFYEMFQEKIQHNNLEKLEISEDEPGVMTEFYLWKLSRINPDRFSWKWENGERLFTIKPPKK